MVCCPVVQGGSHPEAKALPGRVRAAPGRLTPGSTAVTGAASVAPGPLVEPRSPWLYDGPEAR